MNKTAEIQCYKWNIEHKRVPDRLSEKCHYGKTKYNHLETHTLGRLNRFQKRFQTLQTLAKAVPQKKQKTLAAEI